MQDFPPSRAYSTPVNTRFIPAACVLAAALSLVGCHSTTPPPPAPASSHDEAAAANALFLNQKTFDPWVLRSMDSQNPLPTYFSDGEVGCVVGPLGKVSQQYQSGLYRQGELVALPPPTHPSGYATDYSFSNDYQQQFNLETGSLTTKLKNVTLDLAFSGQKPRDWPRLWQTSDIVITGDPEAQQVTHANLFYLLSSTYPGSDHSIPPMGLSSNIYGGHIFWDAEAWMMPALIVQHPDYAKSIIDYRFKTLGQAKKNAKAHGFSGAEYAWESADTGAEMAPAEFAQERHITADVGWAAWQYYLWTGDRAYLAKEGWPVLSATAAYWAARVTHGADGKYHINKVLSPDETAGVVDDDAYTNAVVRANLRAASAAAKLLGQPADPRWRIVADGLFFPYDRARKIPAENDAPMTDRFAAKQADTLLLVHPLGVDYDAATQSRMLDFYAAHTIKNGPAMTASMEAVVAAHLGRGPQSLDLFHDSYRPFMRGPWDAFAEKQTSNRVYFCTGMGGCLQSVLYGFAGLRVVEAGNKLNGTKIAGDEVASLYADPHLPPGWGGLVVKGIRFRGKAFDVAVTPVNKVTVTPHP